MAKRNENENKNEVKNKKLLEKIDALLEKLEAETDPFKRAMYIVKLELLNARIEKQANIIDIKDKYANERKKRIEDLWESRKGITGRKQERIKERSIYERNLRGRSDYDPKSPNFAFKDELKMIHEGDVNQLIEELINEGNFAVAYEIKNAVAVREKYEEARDDLEKMKKEGNIRYKKMKRDNMMSTVKENALIVKENTNIFGKLFNSIKAGINEFRQSREANRLFKIEKKSIEEDIIAKQTREIEAVNNEYERIMEQFRAEFEQAAKYAEEGRSEVISRITQRYESQLAEEVNNRTNNLMGLRNEEARKKVYTIAKDFESKQQEQGSNQQKKYEIRVDDEPTQ